MVQNKELAICRIMAWHALTTKVSARGDTDSVLGHNPTKANSLLRIFGTLTPAAHLTGGLLVALCVWRLFLEVMEIRLHLALYGSLWRNVGLVSLLQWVTLPILIGCVSWRWMMVAANAEDIRSIREAGWGSVQPAVDDRFGRIYASGLLSGAMYYAWGASLMFQALIVFRQLNMHEGIGIFTELLGYAATPLKNIGLVILYIIVLSAALLYYFFLYFGANADFDSYGKSLLSSILLALGKQLPGCS